jgi:hypothetical protein
MAPHDDRALQVYHANGKLYTTLETAAHDPDGSVSLRTAAAWFVIDPGGTSTHVRPSLFRARVLGHGKRQLAAASEHAGVPRANPPRIECSVRSTL